MRKIIVAASLWMAALATPGLAADREACGAGLVCASDPQTVVKALQAAGYKALLSKSKQTGNPKIESAASGYAYSIFFYESEQPLHSSEERRVGNECVRPCSTRGSPDH